MQVVVDETPAKMRRVNACQEHQLDHWRMRAPSVALNEKFHEEDDEDAVSMAEAQGEIDGRRDFDRLHL